jgi:hypothetical protein
MLAMGMAADAAVDAVQNGLSGRQMIRWPNPFGTGFRKIGSGALSDPTHNQQLIGGTHGIVHRLDPGTAGHAALELFRKIALSGGTGRAQEAALGEWLAAYAGWGLVEATEDPNADATAHAALAMVHGHDAFITRLDMG